MVVRLDELAGPLTWSSSASSLTVALAVPVLPCRVTETAKHLAASGVIYGLTLGCWSAIITVVSVGATILVAFAWWSMSELAVVGLDKLGILSMGLTIDAFGPVSDNACNIAKVPQVNKWIQERLGVLDEAGDAAATIEKDLATRCAAHVGHALLELSATEPQLREWTPTTPWGLRGPP